MLGKTQPRELWQDVQAQIEGPVADDLAMNFIGHVRLLVPVGRCRVESDDCHGDGARHARPGGMGGWPRAQNVLISGAMLTAKRPPAPPAKPTGVSVRLLRSAPRIFKRRSAAANWRRPLSFFTFPYRTPGAQQNPAPQGPPAPAFKTTEHDLRQTVSVQFPLRCNDTFFHHIGAIDGQDSRRKTSSLSRTARYSRR